MKRKRQKPNEAQISTKRIRKGSHKPNEKTNIDSNELPSGHVVKHSQLAESYIHPYHLLKEDEILLLQDNLLSWFAQCRRKLPWRGDVPPYSTTSLTRSESSRQKGKGLLKWVVKSNKIDEVSCETNENSAGSQQITGNLVIHRPSAYGILISEVMLQQTQVAVVIPYWLKWMKEWPTIRHLATASEEQVRNMWAGLGYYQRAIRLLRTAQLVTGKGKETGVIKSLENTGNEVILEKECSAQKACSVSDERIPLHSKYTSTFNEKEMLQKKKSNLFSDIEDLVTSQAVTKTKESIDTANPLQDFRSSDDFLFPRDVKGWLHYPGIGEYTAGAILSIAYGIPVPAVDGNVIRVFSRIAAFAAPSDSLKLLKIIQSLASKWMSPVHPGEFNQALMDLGASICTPRSPKCELCPISTICKTWKEVTFNQSNKLQLKSITYVDPRLEAHTLQNNSNNNQKSTSGDDLCNAEDSDNNFVIPICKLCEIQRVSSAKQADDYPLSKSKSINKIEPKTGVMIKRIQYCQAFVIYRKDEEKSFSVLLSKRPEKGLLSHEWGPFIINHNDDQTEKNLNSLIATEEIRYKNIGDNEGTLYEKEQYRIFRDNAKSLGEVRHVFSHITHEVSIFAVEGEKVEYSSGLPFQNNETMWITLSTKNSLSVQLERLKLVSKYMQKIMTCFLEAVNSGQL